MEAEGGHVPLKQCGLGFKNWTPDLAAVRASSQGQPVLKEWFLKVRRGSDSSLFCTPSKYHIPFYSHCCLHPTVLRPRGGQKDDNMGFAGMS